MLHYSPALLAAADGEPGGGRGRGGGVPGGRGLPPASLQPRHNNQQGMEARAGQVRTRATTTAANESSDAFSWLKVPSHL